MASNKFHLDPAANAIFADALRRRRGVLGYTQGEIGEKLKEATHGNFVSMIEAGKTPVPLERAPSFADALRINRSVFFLAVLKAQHPKVWKMFEEIMSDKHTREKLCNANDRSELENFASECIARIGMLPSIAYR